MEKPVEPGPTRTEAEQSAYAQEMAKYTAWLAENPPPPKHHFDPETGEQLE